MLTMKRSLAAVAALAGGLAVMAPAAQAARVSIGIGLGYPAYVAPPPVVYAPPAAYYGAPAYYAAPPVVVEPGYWWYDEWGHRHWRHR